jgi:hypothetical protein
MQFATDVTAKKTRCVEHDALTAQSADSGATLWWDDRQKPDPIEAGWRKTCGQTLKTNEEIARSDRAGSF